MNRALATSFDSLWHSPNLPMWLTLAAAGFFALVLLVTLFRAERSVANGALTVITLLAIGIAVATMLRGAGFVGRPDMAAGSLPATSAAALPALACLDGLAGDKVEEACEKALFASPETVAAAVSYTAAQITRLAAYGNVAAADRMMTPELNALRRAIERDRYGLVAHVLVARDGCSLSDCPFFRSLTNTAQISTNMNEQLYETLVNRHAPQWALPGSPGALPTAAALPASAADPAPVAGLPPAEKPIGRPVSGDFPSAASIPPVNIMTPEPAPQGAQAATPRAAESRAPAPPRPAPAPKKPPAKPKVQAPVPLAPAETTDDN